MTEAALALIRRGDRWFLQRRAQANPVLPGLWEFPGGKLEPGESPLDALRRELAEEVGMTLTSANSSWAFLGRSPPRMVMTSRMI